MEDTDSSGGRFYSVASRPRGIFSFGRKDRKIEEAVDSFFHEYTSTSQPGEIVSTSPVRAQQAQVRKYVVPSGSFGLTVQPGLDAVTEELVRVHPYVHSEKDALVCFKGHLSNTWELQQRVYQWRDSNPADAANNSDVSDMSKVTTSLIMDLYRTCKGSNKLLLSELQGQYAFVLHDAERKSTLAARDPSGAEEFFYKEGEDGIIAWTNSIDCLPPGEDPDDWTEFPPGHFMVGKSPSLQQFALTPEQLRDRERCESWEDDPWLSDEGPSSPKQSASSSKLLGRISRKGSKEKEKKAMDL